MKLDTNIPISSVSYNGVDVPLVGGLLEISTSDEMSQLLAEANIGNIYKFIGEDSDDYVSGDIYIVVTDDSGEIIFEHYENKAVPAIFGDGSDGVGLITASTTWNAETEDTGMIVKNFESLTISEGVTVSAGNRNCGMIIRVKGDCTIHGTLANKMSPKTILDSDGVDFSVYPASMLNGTAGNGGAGGYHAQGVSAAPMSGRLYGGGWSSGGAGGSQYPNAAYIAAGAAGGASSGITTAVANSSLFYGGQSVGHPTFLMETGQYGGGGAGHYSSTAGARGGNGAGGNGSSISYGAGGGGAGNIGGGVIILLVGGNLTITGTIDCSGSNGGNGGGGSGSDYGAGYGGGGSGGGRVFICHKGTISNAGTLNVNGGSGGTGYAAGTAGTIGTTAVKTYEQYMEEDVA